jgi:hypothetical protein
MKSVSGTKNSRTHQEPGDVFEYCFWPGDGKKPVNTDQVKVSALGNINSTNRKEGE